MKIFINKSLLAKIKAGEPTPDVKAFESEGDFWIMDKTEGGAELVPSECHELTALDLMQASVTDLVPRPRRIIIEL